MNFRRIEQCLCNHEQRIEALENGDVQSISTANPEGGDPVTLQFGGYTPDVSLEATGYIIVSINGVDYKLHAELLIP